MNILLMGLPGAGKGTQSEYISCDYDMIHIATGDIFREAIKNETPLGLKAKSYTDHGNLVPNAQAEALDTNLEELNTQIDAVIYIDVDQEVLKDRLSGRIICRKCGATYHKLYNPPKEAGICDQCGSTDFYQREDDKPEKVAHRINLQMESIRPILDYYNQRGILYTINGAQAIEDVYREVRAILEK